MSKSKELSKTLINKMLTGRHRRSKQEHLGGRASRGASDGGTGAFTATCRYTGYGQQKAFEQAQGQFERDRAARADAERLGLGAVELTASQGAQLANLGRMAREGDVEAARLLEGLAKTKHATKLVWILPMKILYVSGITPENSYSSIHPYLEVSCSTVYRDNQVSTVQPYQGHQELVSQDWVCIGA